MRKNRLLLIGIVAVVFLVAARIALPYILLPKINDKLAKISKVVSIHINDLDLSFVRGAYSFEQISVRSKVDKDNREFVNIEKLDISLAWRELLKGQILADAHIDRATIVIGVDISKLNKNTSTDEKKADIGDVVRNLIAFDVSRVTFAHTRVLYFNKADSSELELVSNMEGRISNISNAKRENLEIPSLITAKGDLFGNAMVTVTGTMLPFRTPLPMAFRVKAVGFQLTAANPFLLDYVPFSFTKGDLTLFSEFKIENNNLEGYLKPFFHDVIILSREEKIKNPKHLFVEIGAAFGNLILKNIDTKSTAALIPFSRLENGKFSAEILSTLTSAITNGYVEPLKEEFENSIQLKNFEKYQ